jgi:hypothetical protein
VLTLLTIPPFLARIRAEETSLPTQFDGEYDICCARTSRLIPRLYEDQPRLASTFEMLFDSRRDEGRADGRFGPMGAPRRTGPCRRGPIVAIGERMTRPEKAHRLITPSDGSANSPDRLQLQ